MHDFTPLSALFGGALIGLSASLLLWARGKVAGISGIYGNLLIRGGATRLRVAFVVGMLLAGVLAMFLHPASFSATPSRSLGVTAAAGLLVGYGTRLGNGCTSGHGVCGLSRLSLRSLVATLTFMAFAGLTVFVFDHVLKAGS